MSDDRSRSALAELLSRRAFLAGSAGLWISASLPRPLAAAAVQSDASPRVLGPREWQLVEAITARILPSDDLPGAVEAGCVNFIDKALSAEDAAALPAYRAALRELDRVCQTPGVGGFVELHAEGQDEILTALEEGRLGGWNGAVADPAEFFATIRMHTILGFVLDPRHGGNRDYLGWQVMGYPGPAHHLGGAQADHMTGKSVFEPIWERQQMGSRKTSHGPSEH